MLSIKIMTKQRQLVTTCPIFAMRFLKFTPAAAQNSRQFYRQSLRSLKHGASWCLSLQFSRCFISVLGYLTGNSKARVILCWRVIDNAVHFGTRLIGG